MHFSLAKSCPVVAICDIVTQCGSYHTIALLPIFDTVSVFANVCQLRLFLEHLMQWELLLKYSQLSMLSVISRTFSNINCSDSFEVSGSAITIGGKRVTKINLFWLLLCLLFCKYRKFSRPFLSACMLLAVYFYYSCPFCIAPITIYFPGTKYATFFCIKNS